MKSAYLIAETSFSLEGLYEVIEQESSPFSCRIVSTKVILETPLGDDFEFISIEEETLDSLLDEWYADNPIIDLLVRSPEFDGCSRAFYLTASHRIEESKLFRFLLRLFAAAELPIQVYDCDETQLAPLDFLGRLDSGVS